MYPLNPLQTNENEIIVYRNQNQHKRKSNPLDILIELKFTYIKSHTNNQLQSLVFLISDFNKALLTKQDKIVSQRLKSFKGFNCLKYSNRPLNFFH